MKKILQQFWLILTLIIVVLIISLILNLLTEIRIGDYSTLIIALATIVYAYYSIRNYNELKKQNDFLLKSETEQYILQRKKVILELLKEININEIVLSYYRKKIEEKLYFLEQLETINIDENCLEDLSMDSPEKAFGTFSSKTYDRFSECNLSFKTELNSKLEFYFKTFLLLPKVSLVALKNYCKTEDKKKEVFFKKIRDVVKNINKLLFLGEEIYELVKIDMNIDYKKSDDYIPPFN